MLSLTTHFEERWKERVGEPVPTAREVEAMIRESAKIQKCQDLLTIRGRQIRALALYWHKESGLIFKVDEKRKKVVTVLN